MNQTWKPIQRQVVADHKIFRIRHDLYRRQTDGLTHEFVVLECPDWVNVVAVTKENQLLLVRQFRHGLDAVTWEIPGGVLEPGEAPHHGALRELQEETGYCPEQFELLASIHPNPAFQMNKCHVFLATGCIPQGNQNLDPTEEVELGLFSLSEVAQMILSGQITHSLVLSALLIFLLRKARIDWPKEFSRGSKTS